MPFYSVLLNLASDESFSSSRITKKAEKNSASFASNSFTEPVMVTKAEKNKSKPSQ